MWLLRYGSSGKQGIVNVLNRYEQICLTLPLLHKPQRWSPPFLCAHLALFNQSILRIPRSGCHTSVQFKESQFKKGVVVVTTYNDFNAHRE